MPLSRQRLDNSIGQDAVGELCELADPFSRRRQQTCRQRLIPAICELGYIAENTPDLLFRNVAGQRHRIRATGAHGRVLKD